MCARDVLKIVYMKKVFIFCLLFFILTAEVARAGFGITPPYVRNTSLTRNSTYEQQKIGRAHV